jgi:hypothetical protein
VAVQLGLGQTADRRRAEAGHPRQVVRRFRQDLTEQKSGIVYTM